MPIVINKRSNKCYEVRNIVSNKIHAKCTTLEKAKKQMRLLEAIYHGFIPKKNKCSICNKIGHNKRSH